jgi:hypothetical protein
MDVMKRRLEISDSEPSTKRLIKWLVKWLNTETGPLRERNRDKTRIKRLIGRLQTLSTALRETPRSVHAQEGEVFAIMKHYKMRPLFLAAFDRNEIEIAHQLIGHGSEEGQAIEALQALVAEGLLDRITMCSQCGTKWIFRARKNQQYCSERCRQNRYEGSAERKAQRREYMRKYYRDYLSTQHPRRKKNAKR